MRKYASDLSLDDVLRVTKDGEEQTVVLDYMEVRQGGSRVLVRGYFEQDGSDFALDVDFDHVVKVD
jgi:hypothetical protein